MTTRRRNARRNEQLLDDAAAPPLRPAHPLLALQRQAGNRAAGLLVQRKWAPHGTTADTHLRKGTAEEEAKDGEKAKKATVKSGYFGRTGSEVKAGEQLVADPAQRVGDWTRVVRKDPATWWGPPAKDAAVTYARTTKLTALGDKVGDKYFHGQLGLLSPAQGTSPTGLTPGALFRTADQKTILKVGPNGEDITTPTDFHVADLRALGEVVDTGVRTEAGGKPILRIRGVRYTVVAEDQKPLPFTAPTKKEEAQLYEASQRDMILTRKQLAEDLDETKTPTTQVRRAFASQDGRFTGTVTVTGKPAQGLYAKQLKAVDDALAQLAKHSVPVPDGLEIVISSTADPRFANEAFHSGAGVIFLSSRHVFHVPEVVHDGSYEGGRSKDGGLLGVAHHVALESDTTDKEGLAGAGTVIHEIGHVIHRTASPEVFHKYRSGLEGANEEGDANQVGAITKKVSQYAADKFGGGNITELVAEVFVGVTNGKKYPADVIAAYLKYGGTKTWAKDEDVTSG